MTTSRRPIRRIRRIPALAVATALAAFAVSGCTPSNQQVEERTTRSAYVAFFGLDPRATPTCSMELTSQGSTGDRYQGTCTVAGQAFTLSSLYDEMAPGLWTVYVVATLPLGGGYDRTHSCGFERRGDGPWTLASSCQTILA